MVPAGARPALGAAAIRALADQLRAAALRGHDLHGEGALRQPLEREARQVAAVPAHDALAVHERLHLHDSHPLRVVQPEAELAPVDAATRRRQAERLLAAGDRDVDGAVAL